MIKFLSITRCTSRNGTCFKKVSHHQVAIFGHDAKKNAISICNENLASTSLGQFEVSCYAFAKNEEFGCKLQAVSVSVCDTRSEAKRLLGELT